LVVLFLFAGCNNPQFKSRQAVRDARTHRVLSEFAEHEKAGGQRIDRQFAVHRRLRAQRWEHVTHTRQMIHHVQARRDEQLDRTRPRHRALARSILRGQPEQIDETFARMAY
jgi:hypothetical protein